MHQLLLLPLLRLLLRLLLGQGAQRGECSTWVPVRARHSPYGDGHPNQAMTEQGPSRSHLYGSDSRRIFVRQYTRIDSILCPTLTTHSRSSRVCHLDRRPPCARLARSADGMHTRQRPSV
jgi:hypothetical protein